MKRNLTFEEISDGKRYKADDLAKISCNGCAGCDECCRVTEDTILLDPYDIYELSKGLKKSFEEMLDKEISLTVIDGIITPYLRKRESDSGCVFLQDGLCAIHDFRPGFCRLFPLGRIYNEDGGFDYFIQVHECPYPSKTKVKIKQWLGIPKLPQYEEFVKNWHKVQNDLSNTIISNPEKAKELNLKSLNIFFTSAYDTEENFYTQFEKRINIYTK